MNLLMMCVRVSFPSPIVVVTLTPGTVVVTESCVKDCTAEDTAVYQSCETCEGFVMCANGCVVLPSSGTVT